MLHLFDLGGQLRLVDMPGYGTRPPRSLVAGGIGLRCLRACCVCSTGDAREHWGVLSAGFAKAAPEVREQWDELMFAFFETRAHAAADQPGSPPWGHKRAWFLLRFARSCR